MHLQHMHKALTLMNIKVQNVISQLHGVSGRSIMDAIVMGERNAEHLAELCDVRILKTKRGRVVASLKGNFKAEHDFALKQALAAYDFCLQKQERIWDSTGPRRNILPHGLHWLAVSIVRRPVKLVWSEEFPSMYEAIAAERQIKGWSRKKKEALIRGDFDAIHELAQCRNESHWKYKNKKQQSR